MQGSCGRECGMTASYGFMRPVIVWGKEETRGIGGKCEIVEAQRITTLERAHERGAAAITRS